jgi:hypothetical protein
VEIRINDEPLDFTLEQEETLGEVVEQLQSWLADGGMLIENLSVNGSKVPGDQLTESRDTPLDQVNTVEVTAVSPDQFKLNQLSTIEHVLSLLLATLDRGTDSQVRQILSEYPHMRKPLADALGSGEPANPVFARFDSLAESGATSEELSLAAKQVLLLVQERIRELTEPIAELRSTAQILRTTIPEVSEVSVLLQTGKDREAMAAVVRFTELSDKLIRLYGILVRQGRVDLSASMVEEERFAAFYEDLNQVLRELSEAMAAGDSVLVGDLLEYEIAPRLEKLIQFLDRIEASSEDT